MDDDEFERKFCDGGFDGGIDLFYQADNSFYIVQSKFTATPRDLSLDFIENELNKINDTITNTNTNKKAEYFHQTYIQQILGRFA